MKKLFLTFIMVTLSQLILANEMSNPCVYHPDLPGCSGNNRPIGQTNRVVKIPNRWGVIYYNPANDAVGYAENNTEGYRSANKEALANCIKAGGGQNPLHRDGKGCRKMTEVRNACSAIAVGSKSASAKSDDYLEKAEQKAFDGCSQYSNDCKILYSGCSRHPDY
ncbi:DUF4189 domain-containing protein [Neisseria sp. CP9]|jgi:hypothetical protein|uniref:PF13827 domain protein n=1 Tax=Neisseria sicca VK64 TaxID=1095748 RepID=I2NE60_NEISI|nr:MULTISPECIES: DUF4189 domain-containing protein [Neisseria]EIG24121.1 PF13827 domain protein [Neisseria sicca VK64]OFO28569.1 hypothetical protein HMPREF3050_10785 [Neisseria sp. HMSC065D04]